MTQNKFIKILIVGTVFIPSMLGISSVALSQSQQDIRLCSQLKQGLQEGDPDAQQFVQQNPNVVPYCRRVLNSINTINNTTTGNARVMCRKTKQKIQDYWDRDEMPPASTAAMRTYWCVNMGGE